MTLDEIFTAVLKDEGGWSNHPADNGGATMYGVLFSEWQKWVHPRKVDIAQFRKITPDDAKAVFRAWYWDPLNCEKMVPGLAYMVFDCGLLHGIHNSARWLQIGANAKVDGHVGAKTIEAVGDADPSDLIAKMHELRMKRIKGHADYKVFGRGWINRALRVKKRALANV
jgi:lysozyme family protein